MGEGRFYLGGVTNFSFDASGVIAGLSVMGGWLANRIRQGLNSVCEAKKTS